MPARPNRATRDRARPERARPVTVLPVAGRLAIDPRTGRPVTGPVTVTRLNLAWRRLLATGDVVIRPQATSRRAKPAASPADPKE